MTPAAKKLIALIFLFFLLLFPRYAPWISQDAAGEHSLVQQIFTLYFFVASQTLGIVHEAGHGVCYILPCPEFFMVANGTIFQLLFPAMIAYYYQRKSNTFAALIALFFVGFSLQYTAWYMSTAHEGLFLPASKSFLGVDAYHDFNYLFSSLGLMPYEKLLSGLTKLIAYLIMFYTTGAMLFQAFVQSHSREESG
jgi:hypothetical protein